MSKQYNCPNCGAPMGYAEKCEYCGTLLNWIPTMQIEYVPKNLNVREAKCCVRISKDQVDEISFEDILKDLSQKLADFIVKQKAYRLSKTYDWIRDCQAYIMKTYIGVEHE